MPRRVVIVISVVVAAIVAFAIVARDDGSPGSADVSASPALLAVDGVTGLPETVAELPVVDAPGFRSLMAELRGTPVVVNLWAAWCEPCEVEMPRLTEAALAHPGVQFIGIDTLDSRESAEAFIEEYSVPFPSLFDPQGTVRTELDSIGLPVTAFFDAGGNQVAKVDGELSQGELDRRLAEIDAIEG